MNAVRFHPEADQELVEARQWYEARSEVAAQAFALEVDRAIERILEAPFRYPTGWRGERRFVLERFRTRFFIASARITSSSRQLRIRAGVPATGVTGDDHRAKEFRRDRHVERWTYLE